MLTNCNKSAKTAARSWLNASDDFSVSEMLRVTEIP